VLSWTRRVGGVPVACGLLAVALSIITMVPSLRPAGWSLTVLPRVGDTGPMAAAARTIDPGFRTVQTGAYDGQWYWGIAIDPLATGSLHHDFDTAPYRYGHPLYGWLGWLFSGGQARAVPASLVVVSLASMLFAGIFAGGLGRAAGRQGWEGLFVALNPGLLYAAAHDLAEPLLAALATGGLLAYVRGRRSVALVCFALLPFAKEPFLFVPLGVAAWELYRRRARLREIVPLLLTLVPAVVWWISMRIHLGGFFTAGRTDTTLAAPLAAWKRALLDAGVFSYSSDSQQNALGETAIVLLVALGGLLLVAAVLSLRLRGPIEAAFLPIVVLIACVGTATTENQRDILRVASVLVVLAPFTIASPAPVPGLRRAGNGSTPGGPEPRRPP